MKSRSQGRKRRAQALQRRQRHALGLGGHGGSAYGCVIIRPQGRAMLEGRCWRGDAGGAIHHGVSAPMHQGISASPKNYVLLCLPFVGVDSVAAVGFGGHILLSSLALSRRNPPRRMRQAGAQQRTSRGTLAGGTLAHRTLAWIWALGPRLFSQGKISCRKG